MDSLPFLECMHTPPPPVSLRTFSLHIFICLHLASVLHIQFLSSLFLCGCLCACVYLGGGLCCWGDACRYQGQR